MANIVPAASTTAQESRCRASYEHPDDRNVVMLMRREESAPVPAGGHEAATARPEVRLPRRAPRNRSRPAARAWCASLVAPTGSQPRRATASRAGVTSSGKRDGPSQRRW